MAEPKGHKPESDVDSETHEARSRAKEDDSTYVGQTEPDDALDVGETGAEARADGG